MPTDEITAVAAGAWALGDLTVNRMGFGSMRITANPDRDLAIRSLGTFSTRFTELVGVPPSVYRRRATRATAGIPGCVAKQVTRPIRNREARTREPQLA